MFRGSLVTTDIKVGSVVNFVFKKYRVRKFGNRRTDGRMHGQKSLTVWLNWRRHEKDKKLSYRRETARRFVLLNILLSHSKSLKLIRNHTVEYGH